MSDRNKLNAIDRKVKRSLSELDKTFDESMVILLDWLLTAQNKGFLTQERAIKIFQEELKARRGHGE